MAGNLKGIFLAGEFHQLFHGKIVKIVWSSTFHLFSECSYIKLVDGQALNDTGEIREGEIFGRWKRSKKLFDLFDTLK